MGIEKYRELYDLSKELLKEEHERFHRVDDKAAHYLSVVTLLIGIQGALGPEALKSLIPPTGLLQWLLLNVGILSFFMLLTTWFIIFRTLRVQGLFWPPLNEEMIKFFDTQSEINIYYHLAKANGEARQTNIKLTDLKCKSLAYGYRMLIATVCMFVLFVCLLFVQSWHTVPNSEKAQTMSEKNNQEVNVPKHEEITPAPPNQSKPATEAQPKAELRPDPNVVPPKYIALANERNI